MNFDPIAELNVSASKIESDWLTPMDDAASFLKGGKPLTAENSPMAVVRVPVFFDRAYTPASGPSDISNSHSAELRVLPNHMPAVRDRTTPQPYAERPVQQTSAMPAVSQTRGTETVARQISRGVTDQVTGVPMAVPVSSDLIEKPEDWLGGTKENSKEERNKTENTSHDPEPAVSIATVNIDSQSIEDLTHQILNRFPLAFPTVLLFAGSEWNPHVDETCAQVAYQLASRHVGKVLLVDSEFEKSELTNATGTSSQPGMAEIFNRKLDLDGCIADHEEANMDFLPAGTEPIWHWRIAGDNVRSIVKSFKSSYQFVCISVGDAHGEAAKIWAADTEGTYLIVSMSNSSQTVAKSAVDQLHANGARLLGCIVSDAIVN